MMVRSISQASASFFDGRRNNRAIRYSALIGLAAYSDALVLEKGTGKGPHLVLDDVELAAVTLSAAMAET